MTEKKGKERDSGHIEKGREKNEKKIEYASKKVAVKSEKVEAENKYRKGDLK